MATSYINQCSPDIIYGGQQAKIRSEHPKSHIDQGNPEQKSNNEYR